MSDLLLVACSKRKLHTTGLLPAGSRYDGVAFRVVKRARREGYAPRNLTILILSAKYGLITEGSMIEDYDQVMDRERATGRPGERQAQLRSWLWKRADAQVERTSSSREMDR